MKSTTHFYLLLLLLAFSMPAYAQTNLPDKRTINSSGDPNSDVAEGNPKQNDSLLNFGNPKNVFIYSFYSDYIAFPNQHVVDTNLRRIEQYNPTKQANAFYQDLGNIGSSSLPILFIPHPKFAFDIGISSFDLFLKDLSEIELIETPSPFTQLSYTMGSKKENSLRIQHAQSFMDKQIKAGLDFQLFNSIGYYNQQHTDVKNFNANIGYQTKDKRYAVDAVYFHNKIVNEENGGILYDSLYRDNLESNREIIDINLANAENYIKYSGVAIKQNLFISKPEPDYSGIPDTNTINYDGFSVQHYKKPFFNPIMPLGKITHTFIFSKEIYQYTDTDGASAFYENILFPFEVTSTFDSISNRKIENLFEYSNANYKDNLEHPKYLFYAFGLGINTNSYNQFTKNYSINLTVSEINPQAKIQLFLAKSILFSASGRYSYRSDNTSAYNLDGKIKLSFGKNLLSASVQSTSLQPKMIFNHNYSDYFRWDNNFKNQKFQELRFDFQRASTKVNVKTALIHDYLYFDEYLSPQQHSAALSYLGIYMNQEFHINHFGLDMNFAYQKVSDPGILPLPEIFTSNSIYYTNKLFKNALEMEIGITIRYFTKYYAQNYMPALRSFYLQNEKLFGNYPYFDFYVNAKIKRARIFFKYEQFNTSFMAENFFITLHYPNQDASLKFGVIWQLFN